MPARNIEDLGERLRTLIAAPDRAGSFLWKLFSDLFVYSAGMVPEISDRIVEIDRAMRWGYANKLGPFELWDALGFQSDGAAHRERGRPLPPNVQKMLSSGATSFYRPADRDGSPRTEYFDLARPVTASSKTRPGILVAFRPQARARRGEEERRRVADRRRRRRALPRVSQQDELASARTQIVDDSRRASTRPREISRP